MFGIGGIELIIFVLFLLVFWFLYKTIMRKKLSKNGKIERNNMRPKKTKDFLNITEKTIKYSGQTYQLINITQVSKLKVTHKRIGKIIFSIVLAAAGLVIANGPNEFRIVSVFLFPLAFLILIWALVRKNKYALVLETNSGSAEIMSSKDEKFIDELIGIISDVMEKQVSGTNIVAYPKKMQIINNSFNKNVGGDEVAGDKFGNINKSNFVNRSNVGSASNTVNTAYDDEVLKALDDIEKHIREHNDTVSEVLIEKLRELMNESKPDKSKIKSLWNNLVKMLPDVSTVVKSIRIITGAI
jgi:hypothetical protein